MSKRARITLNPEMETEPYQATQAESVPLPDKEPPTHNGFTAAADKPSRPSLPAQRALNVGIIVKVVLAGLAVASLLLLWKNRRL
ncbi:MAG: hypothetical protein ABF290_13160 [Thiogranum sp.]